MSTTSKSVRTICALTVAGIASTLAFSAASVHSKDMNKEEDTGSKQKLTQRGFVIHDRQSAPEPTKEVLDFYQTNFNFVPHLVGIMADSPALVRSYWQLQTNLMAYGTLSPPENNIVQMSIAVENQCQYCVAGHTLAGKMYFNSPAEQLEALRNESSLPEEKFNALRDFALAVNETKGRVSDEQLRDFYSAGYTRQQALDVVANIASKVMTNFTNQIAETPLDEAIVPLAEGLPYTEQRRIIER